jgi:predicted metal-dependent phosphoesterase TrpH
MTADLHTHTNRSDGLLAPADLVKSAKSAGLRTIAVTDHDSVAGIDEACAAAARLGIEVIPGVELSIRERDPETDEVTDHHLLGLFVDPAEASLGEFLEQVQEGRRAMARDTLASLEQLGMHLDPHRVEELAAGAAVTRPHIARALVEAGYVASEREAFERFLGNGKLAAPERPAPSAAEAIAVVRAAGGIPGLAHPVFTRDGGWQARLAALPRQLDRLLPLGLGAVECFYPDATPEVSEWLGRWTSERDLIVTGGSDFHGPGKAPYVALGHSAVADSVVEVLRRALPAKLDCP